MSSIRPQGSQQEPGRPRRLVIAPAILLSLKAVWESGLVDCYHVPVSLFLDL